MTTHNDPASHLPETYASPLAADQVQEQQQPSTSRHEPPESATAEGTSQGEQRDQDQGEEQWVASEEEKERLEQAEALKLKGNKMFGQGLYEEASAQYWQVLWARCMQWMQT
jgi:hypothetical protein